MTTVIYNTPETGQAQRNPDPYNVGVPVIGQANYEPRILGPLGTQPHFLPKNQYWPWVYGS